LNLKGGVAKTVTTVNVAAILAKDYGHRVLVIDADSQCNATDFLGGDPEIGNLAEVLRRDSSNYAAWGIQVSNVKGVDILAGDSSLMDLDLTKVELKSVSATILREMVQQFREQRLYDWVLIDCPPAFNAASTAALLAADEVIIPIKLDAFSLRGMTNLMRQIANMRQINPDLKLGGLLPTMWYKSDNITDAEAQLQASGLPVYPHIRRTKLVDDMTFEQQPLTISSPKSAACIDYRKFAKQLVKEAD
jgi:chromosome partitioning protein